MSAPLGGARVWGERGERGALEARADGAAGLLEVTEPGDDAVREASAELAAFYNEPYNAARLCNTVRFSAEDVLALWRENEAKGLRSVLLVRDGALVGDAFFRRLAGRAVELGVLIGPRPLQGLGLGGRFLKLLLGLAFGPLESDRVCVAIRPENAPSLRLFARAGFTVDDDPRARGCADTEDEVCMVLDAEVFGRRPVEPRPESPQPESPQTETF